LPERAARRVFLQLVSAIIYRHVRGVTHRDVKQRNVLLNADGNLKVCDFGLAALPESHRDNGRLHTTCGTPAFAAPEVLYRKGYDGVKPDACSCGVILYVLLAGRLPAVRRLQHHQDVQEGAPPRVHAPGVVSPPTLRLVSRLLHPNPATRLTVAELSSHPWFKRSLSLDSQL
ncbi:hypothetical protein CFC21_064098, partial [Triticum aestivum]